MRHRIALVLSVAAAIGAAPQSAGKLPPIVFVSRQPIPGEPGAVPGLGPHHRAAVTGGRLRVREPDGRLRELVPDRALYDVSDPTVSFDAKRVAFAGTTDPDSVWRIWIVNLDGSELRQVTHDDRALDLAPLGALAARFARYDDLDPCWIGADEICFSSTRYPLVAEYADVPATNLFVVEARGGGSEAAPVRITSERNGADEPAYDARADRVVFARWWFSRFKPSRDGITTDGALAMSPDSVNFWQALSIPAHGGVGRLACGSLRTRRETMAYQPAVLADGSVTGVYALNLGLSPRPGPLGIQRFPVRRDRTVGRVVRLAGAIVPDSVRGTYTEALGLAAPAACSPAGLPDGRVLFSYAPGARGDFGLYIMDRDGRSPPVALVDLPGTLELDAAPAVTRPMPRRSHFRAAAVDLPARPATIADSLAGRGTFTYRSLGVFASSHTALARQGPAPTPGARIRFFAAPLVAAHATRDTALLLREVPLRPDGSVEASGLPADVPLFEQVVDARGHVLSAAHGPAHVAGFNAGLPGSTSRCMGCHFGHSSLEVPTRRGRARRAGGG